ncbi:MAG: sigma-70 family RNA polymerase sigma factor [Acidobacteriota bacterium]
MPTLFERVASGDASSMQECIDRFRGLVWSMARKRGLGDEDAEDLLQEVMIEVWKSASRYDSAQASEPAFVAMITRRRLIDRIRRQQRRPVTQPIVPDLHDGADREHEHLENRVELAMASRALDCLRPRERHVLLLSTLQGMSHGQISESTGIPLGTVKTYIRRGLMRVRSVLEAPQPSLSTSNA